MTPDQQPYFISYARADYDFVLKLTRDLKASGANVWLDQTDIALSEIWDVAIEKALTGTTRMMIVLSPAAVASRNVMDEASFAMEEGKVVIPILYQHCEIPFRLRRLQRSDFTTDYDHALDELLRKLGLDPRNRDTVPVEPIAEQPRKPYDRPIQPDTPTAPIFEPEKLPAFDARPAEPRPAEPRPAEPKPVETGPVEARPFTPPIPTTPQNPQRPAIRIDMVPPPAESAPPADAPRYGSAPPTYMPPPTPPVAPQQPVYHQPPQQQAYQQPYIPPQAQQWQPPPPTFGSSGPFTPEPPKKSNILPIVLAAVATFIVLIVVIAIVAVKANKSDNNSASNTTPGPDSQTSTAPSDSTPAAQPQTEPQTQTATTAPAPNASPFCRQLKTYVAAAPHAFAGTHISTIQQQPKAKVYTAIGHLSGMTDCEVWIYDDMTPSLTCDLPPGGSRAKLKSDLNACLPGWEVRKSGDPYEMYGPNGVGVRVSGNDFWIDSP